MKFCERCGMSIGEKSRYCPQCGSFIEKYEKFSLEEETEKFCSGCGAPVEKSYCGNCGTYAKIASLKEETTLEKHFLKKAGNVSERVKKGNRKLPKLSGKVVCMLVVVFLVAGVGVWQYVEKQVLEPQRATQWVHYTENGKVGFYKRKGEIKGRV